jgi:Domain of unknown function (DUF4349)/Putative zinc-finger
MTVHEVSPEEVMALLDGELSAERAAAVSRHVEECAACKEIQQPTRATAAALASWVVPEQRRDTQFENRLLELARNASTRGPDTGVRQFAPFFRRHWVMTAAASTLAVVLVLKFSSDRFVMHQMSSAQAKQSLDRWTVYQRGKTVVQENLQPVGGPVADSNGLVHGLGYDAEKAISVDRQPPTDEQGKVFVFAAPMIARTVSLSIVAKDFAASRAALDAILSQHHAYAASLAVNTQQNSARSLEASLRVPAAELGAVMAKLRSLGRVQNETQNGEEVTQQHADLVARLKNSRETEIRLQDILRNRTGKISDVLAVEQEIARVRGEIEQMEAEQKSLEHRVEYATVDLNLSEEYKAQLRTPAPSISTRFHNALVKGIRSAQETVVGITLFCAEVGPSLVIWLVMLLPLGWFLWRRWRRTYGLASSASV